MKEIDEDKMPVDGDPIKKPCPYCGGKGCDYCDGIGD